jgi:hypothetical protein
LIILQKEGDKDQDIPDGAYITDEYETVPVHERNTDDTDVGNFASVDLDDKNLRFIEGYMKRHVEYRDDIFLIQKLELPTT